MPLWPIFWNLWAYTLYFMYLLPLRLSCVFLANYVPKCQMSSGPCGPIFVVLCVNLWLIGRRSTVVLSHIIPFSVMLCFAKKNWTSIDTYFYFFGFSCFKTFNVQAKHEWRLIIQIVFKLLDSRKLFCSILSQKVYTITYFNIWKKIT